MTSYFCGATVVVAPSSFYLCERDMTTTVEQQDMTTTATNAPTINGDTNGNTNGSTNGKTRAAITPVDAIGRISKILDQLSPSDRRRVLTFVSVESGE